MAKSKGTLSRLAWSSVIVGGLALPFLAPAQSAVSPAAAESAPSSATAPGGSASAGQGSAGRGDPVTSVVPSKRKLEFLTAEWTGERYPGGRPKVSDDVLERMKIVTIEAAWGALRGKGYHNQFAGDWEMIHTDQPVIGRALTAQYMPSSPALQERRTEAGHKAGHDGNMNTWPIEMLENGDVYVADGYGKIEDGTLIGGNLGSRIYDKTGNGVVFDGSARDLGELEDIEGFNAYVRGWDPSYIQEMMLTGINIPTRIGEAVVLPGDVVLARREGVVFIPAHLAEYVVRDAEETLVVDRFTKIRLDDGTYTTGQLDTGWRDWAPEIKQDFRSWLEENKEDLPIPPERVQEIIDSI